MALANIKNILIKVGIYVSYMHEQLYLTAQPRLPIRNDLLADLRR